MTFAAHVKGGTGAGRKVQKTREPWTCACEITLTEPARFAADVEVVTATSKAPGIYATEAGSSRAKRWHRDRYSCPDCGTRRP